MEPRPDDTVVWTRLTFDDLADIKPGSALAKKIMAEAMTYASAWRPAYINAVERIVVNPDMMIDEDAPITEPTTLDNEDGAYVMCWQFIPHAAVIPPTVDKKADAVELARLKTISEHLGT
jgi:hypothetical protein